MSGNLQRIPGIGPSMAQDLRDLGIYRVGDLVGKNPELMYKRLCQLHRMDLDRCVLYVFRCAVYFANNEVHDPELLKWWNWKSIPPNANVPAESEHHQ
jgi:nucleotidyltransferase/DNA polymerase involved in DNA repair